MTEQFTILRFNFVLLLKHPQSCLALNWETNKTIGSVRKKLTKEENVSGDSKASFLTSKCNVHHKTHKNYAQTEGVCRGV